MVHKSVAMTRPFFHAGTVLEVVHIGIPLPFLQRRSLANQSKLKGSSDKVKVLQLDQFSELLSYVKADNRTGNSAQRENHKTVSGRLAARSFNICRYAPSCGRCCAIQAMADSVSMEHSKPGWSFLCATSSK